MRAQTVAPIPAGVIAGAAGGAEAAVSCATAAAASGKARASGATMRQSLPDDMISFALTAERENGVAGGGWQPKLAAVAVANFFRRAVGTARKCVPPVCVLLPPDFYAVP